MAWTLSFAPTFLNELLGLPQQVSKLVTQKVKVLEQDPISARGDAKKLGGYKNNVYRVRIGDYRLFYSFGQGWVKLLSVRKRDEHTYGDDDIDVVSPSLPPDLAVLDPQPTVIHEPRAVYQFTPAVSDSDRVDTVTPPLSNPLPFDLTTEMLGQWQIPQEYWAGLTAARDEDALLALPLPNQVLDRVLDNLFPRSIAEIERQPEYVLAQPEDLDRYVEGELSAFLLKLDPTQQEILAFGGTGPTLVKGGPGTGKSVLALYRAQRLLDAGHAPLLFTTYTNALVSYSEQLLGHLLGAPPKERGAEVSTVNSLIFKYYVRTHGQPNIATEAQLIERVEAALAETSLPSMNVFDENVRREMLRRLGSSYLLDEFLQVIEAWGIDSREAYLAFERRGRQLPLRSTIREALWAVYEAWSARLERDHLTSWERMRRASLEIVRGLPEKPYRALVIDEAQDLSPVALRFLLALVESPAQIYLTADASQSLYQRGFSWKQIHADFNVRGRTLLLKRNYRNTAEIAAACAAIMQGSGAGDDECVDQQPSPFSGSAPTLLLNDDTENDAAAIQAFFASSARQYRLPIHAGAVLCQSQHIGHRVAARLSRLGLPAEFMAGKTIDLKKPCVKVMTLHSAKGLEFPFVAVLRLEQGVLPYDTSHLPQEEVAAALDQQRRLFYVGCSRAMRALLVCGSASSPSPFAEPLVVPLWQRQEAL